MWRRGCRSRPARRVDFHSEYGTFFSPRLALLFRRDGWTSRLSAAQGFFASTPLTEETEAAGLSRLDVIATARGRARTDRVARPHAHRRRRVVHGDALRLAR